MQNPDQPPIVTSEIAAIAAALENLIIRWASMRNANMWAQMAVAETVFLQTWARLIKPTADAGSIAELAKRIPLVLDMIRADNGGPVGHG